MGNGVWGTREIRRMERHIPHSPFLIPHSSSPFLTFDPAYESHRPPQIREIDVVFD